MYNENLEQLLKFNKTFNTPISEWNKILTDMSKRVADQNLELFGEQVTQFSSHLKRISNIKKPEDLLSLQKDILTEIMHTNLETTQKIMHMTIGNLEQLAKLWETTTAKTAEKTVEKTQKFSEK